MRGWEKTARDQWRDPCRRMADSNENNADVLRGGVVCSVIGTPRCSNACASLAAAVSSGGGVGNTPAGRCPPSQLNNNNAANISVARTGGLLNFAGRQGRLSQHDHRAPTRPPASSGYPRGGTWAPPLKSSSSSSPRTPGGGNRHDPSGDMLQLRGSIVANNIEKRHENCSTARSRSGTTWRPAMICFLSSQRRGQRGRG